MFNKIVFRNQVYLNINNKLEEKDILINKLNNKTLFKIHFNKL